AALLLAVVVGVQLNSGDDGQVIASVELVNDDLPVANPDAGTAELVSVEGGYALEVSVPDLPTTDGYYELWVIDNDVVGMHSLGEVSGSGQFDLPPGVDPADFPIVDISVEAHDGDEAHGGQSIWRGTLSV
ncbi:MAG: anti-sigma factor, partial [Acidimicrobiia bacterium]|nr:anti-sigma factor [Acidimicrobiia bacterium]